MGSWLGGKSLKQMARSSKIYDPTTGISIKPVKPGQHFTLRSYPAMGWLQALEVNGEVVKARLEDGNVVDVWLDEAVPAADYERKGYTGRFKDETGRNRCYQDGEPVPCSMSTRGTGGHKRRGMLRRALGVGAALVPAAAIAGAAYLGRHQIAKVGDKVTQVATDYAGRTIRQGTLKPVKKKEPKAETEESEAHGEEVTPPKLHESPLSKEGHEQRETPEKEPELASVQDYVNHHPVFKIMGEQFKVADEDDPRVMKEVEHLANLNPEIAQRVTAKGVRMFLGTQLPSAWGYKDKKFRTFYDSTKKVIVIDASANHATRSVTLHEYGHAVADVLGYGKSSELVQFHDQLYPRLSPYIQGIRRNGKQDLAYGQQELFAEGFCDMHLMDRRAMINKYNEGFVNFMEEVIKGAGVEQAPEQEQVNV